MVQLNEYQRKYYGASPGPCDRLDCKLKGCYGWDYCRQAREVATHEDWELMKKIVFGVHSSVTKVNEK